MDQASVVNASIELDIQVFSYFSSRQWEHLSYVSENIVFSRKLWKIKVNGTKTHRENYGFGVTLL